MPRAPIGDGLERRCEGGWLSKAGGGAAAEARGGLWSPAMDTTSCTREMLLHVAPNSCIHLWCFATSSGPTDLEIFFNASSKSDIVT